MMKSINISTKFTILILVVSLVTVTAISFFSYDYHLKANQEKFATNLAAIADNQTAYFNTYFERAEQAIQILQNSEKIKTGLAGGVSNSDGVDMMMPPIAGDGIPTDSTEGPTELTLVDYLNLQKEVLQVT